MSDVTMILGLATSEHWALDLLGFMLIVVVVAFMLTPLYVDGPTASATRPARPKGPPTGVAPKPPPGPAKRCSKCGGSNV